MINENYDNLRVSSASSLDLIAEFLAKISAYAGEELLKFHKKDCNFTFKKDGSPISEADLAADTLITSYLKTNFPDYQIISEEGEIPETLDTLDKDATFFLVDPLDGTKTFLAGGSEFCVLIALIKHGIPIAGAIHAPISGITWWAASGKAFRCANRSFIENEEIKAEYTQRTSKVETGFEVSALGNQENNSTISTIETQAISTEKKEIKAVISNYYAKEKSRFLCAAFGIKSFYSINSALKFIEVAEGRADIYPRLGKIMQWDIAAGDAILRALGGGIYDLNNQSIEYGLCNKSLIVEDFIAVSRKEILRPLISSIEKL